MNDSIKEKRQRSPRLTFCQAFHSLTPQHFPQGCMISKASQHYKGTESRETPQRAKEVQGFACYSLVLHFQFIFHVVAP